MSEYAPIVGLVGFARSGKDSVANVLQGQGWQRLAFADRLKTIALSTLRAADDRLANHVEALGGWDEAKNDPHWRHYLQEFGQGHREVLGEDVWIDPVIRDAARLSRVGTPVVITDVRYENELDAILWQGGRILKVVRPGVEPVNGHVTEQLAARIGIADAQVRNVGTLAGLPVQVSWALDAAGIGPWAFPSAS